MFSEMIKPDLYHGRIPWNKFEGWYFKICDSTGVSFSLIPGVLMEKGEEHSFIQFLWGKDNLFSYFRKPYKSFKATKMPFTLSIDENSFSFDGISINIANNEMKIEGDLVFTHCIKWNPVGPSHRSMGLYNFIPFMECYSQVCVMNMNVSGYITVNGKTHFIKDGFGYIEKNWGNAFPHSWIWIQSNCFTQPATALSASIAHIPFPIGSFRGFLIGFYHQDEFYSFTTMNRSVLSIKKEDGDVRLSVENKNYVLDISTKSDKGNFILCKGPRNGQMIDIVKETLTAKVYVKLTEKSTQKIVIEAEGINTGIEYGGEQMKLIN